jgi:hypothetical protein
MRKVPEIDGHFPAIVTLPPNPTFGAPIIGSDWYVSHRTFAVQSLHRNSQPSLSYQSIRVDEESRIANRANLAKRMFYWLRCPSVMDRIV